MRKILILLILINRGYNSYSQNLIPNPSFEDTVSCPTNVGNLNHTYSWIAPSTGSPDYFNSCTGNLSVSVPHNIQGFQYAHGGDAYVGIAIYAAQGVTYREYIEVQIDTPLLANKCYHFEMYCNQGNRSQYTTDAIGVYFSDTMISGITSSSELQLIPQIENSTGNYLDTLNWTLVSGTYTANGGENYIIIGNFKNDSNTVAIFNNGNGLSPGTYSYIDDVLLTENEVVQIDLGNDTTLCQGEDLLLNAAGGFQNYMWQDSSTAQTYLFNDTSVGNYNLNLTALDSSGCPATGDINVSVEICGSIESLSSETQNFLYPNPASNQLTIYSEQLSGSKIELLDMLGKKIYEKKPIQKTEIINLDSFTDGVYFAKVRMQNGEIVVKKFIKD